MRIFVSSIADFDECEKKSCTVTPEDAQKIPDIATKINAKLFFKTFTCFEFQEIYSDSYFINRGLRKSVTKYTTAAQVTIVAPAAEFISYDKINPAKPELNAINTLNT